MGTPNDRIAARRYSGSTQPPPGKADALTSRVPNVDEVYTALLDRIGTGSIAVGSKLPSCRRLAHEMGSNPSTVNRAIRRLARHGLVRTEPRKGSYLVNDGAVAELTVSEAEQEFRRAVVKARRAGFGTARIREMFEASLSVGGTGLGRIAFVECNQYDLDRMLSLVRNATGVALEPILLDKLDDSWENSFDHLAAPMFHLTDIAELGIDLDKVTELNFVPSTNTLRQLASIGPREVVGVIAPTSRGVTRIAALANQYTTGTIHELDINKPDKIKSVDVLVYPAALDTEALDLSSVPIQIKIDWELDPTSAATFVGRAAQNGNGE